MGVGWCPTCNEPGSFLRMRTFAFDTLSLRRLWPSVCAEEAVAAKLRVAEVSGGCIKTPSSRRASQRA